LIVSKNPRTSFNAYSTIVPSSHDCASITAETAAKSLNGGHIKFNFQISGIHRNLFFIKKVYLMFISFLLFFGLFIIIHLIGSLRIPIANGLTLWGITGKGRGRAFEYFLMKSINKFNISIISDIINPSLIY
jgi:hypothetical protein